MKYNQPYGVSDPNAPYINGDPSIGRAGSIPPAASIEFPQREIVNLITDCNLLAPDNGDLHQLAKSIQSNLLFSDDDAGTSNAYQVTQTPPPTAYFKYMTIVMKVLNTNTGASVLNVNALGPKPIKHPADNSELSAGELRAGSIACFIFDGVYFHLVWTSSGSAAVAGATIYLTQPVDLYVNANTGNDTYDGSAAVFTVGTIHGPWRTLQQASNVINRYNLNGFNVNVHVADGAYQYFNLPSPTGSGNVIWTGNTGSPANVTVLTADRTAVQGYQIGNQTINGFKLSSMGNYATFNDPLTCCYVAGNQSVLTFNNIEFGGSPGAMVSATRSAQIGFYDYGTFKVSGSSPGNPGWIGAFCYASASAQILNNPNHLPTLTITVPITIGYGWMVASISAMAQQSMTYVNPGNVTGQKYYASLNGVINSSSGGPSYYPGTIAGAVASGGQYA